MISFSQNIFSHYKFPPSLYLSRYFAVQMYFSIFFCSFWLFLFILSVYQDSAFVLGWCYFNDIQFVIEKKKAPWGNSVDVSIHVCQGQSFGYFVPVKSGSHVYVMYRHIKILLYYTDIKLLRFMWLQTLVEGAMVGHTPKGMQLAQDTLVWSLCSFLLEFLIRCLDCFNPICGSTFSYAGKHEFQGLLLEPKNGE